MIDTNDTHAKKAGLKLPFEYRASFLRAWKATNIMDLDYGANPNTYFDLFATKMEDLQRQVNNLNEKIREAVNKLNKI